MKHSRFDEIFIRLFIQLFMRFFLRFLIKQMPYTRDTQSSDRGPDSGPPEGSQWTAEDHQSVLTKTRSMDPGRLWKFCNVDPGTKSLITPAIHHEI